MDPYSMEQVLISALVGWGLTLGVAAIVRFSLHQEPLSKGWAFGFCAAVWVIWMVYGAEIGEPVNQGALFILLLCTYFLLTYGTSSESKSGKPSRAERTAGPASSEPPPPKPSNSTPEALREINQKKNSDGLSGSSKLTLGSDAAGKSDSHGIRKDATTAFIVIVVLAVLGIPVLYFSPLSEKAHQLPTGQSLSWNDNNSRVVNALKAWAEVGNLDAQFRLARRYESGGGTIRDLPQAYCWYSHAAMRGYPGAMNNLGNLYWRGEGTEVNKVQAHALYNLASARGSENAPNNRDRIERDLTDEEHTEALAIARSWEPAPGLSSYSWYYDISLPPIDSGSPLPPMPDEERERAYFCEL